jgi:Asp-tRNA(Asn)/Glu-tRNA(Gln) amidotransferase A subunit family amidase
MGKQFAEERIINVAYMYEQATDWHTKHPIL